MPSKRSAYFYLNKAKKYQQSRVARLLAIKDNLFLCFYSNQVCSKQCRKITHFGGASTSISSYSSDSSFFDNNSKLFTEHTTLTMKPPTQTNTTQTSFNQAEMDIIFEFLNKQLPAFEKFLINKETENCQNKFNFVRTFVQKIRANYFCFSEDKRNQSIGDNMLSLLLFDQFCHIDKSEMPSATKLNKKASPTQQMLYSNAPQLCRNSIARHNPNSDLLIAELKIALEKRNRRLNLN